MQSITLPSEPQSVALARSFVRDVVGDGADAESAVLMTSELVANVVLHVGTEVTLGVEPGPPVRVEVRDGEAPTDVLHALVDQPPHVADTAPGGRGLRIVHTLATRIGLGSEPAGGKVIWFEL